MESKSAPKLAAPGKGLPFWQALIVRYLFFPRFCKQSSWESAQALFDGEARKILDLVKPLPSEAFRTRVLVKPLTGLEDSSRFWSAAMTLEHLIIVGREIAEAVVLLSQGKEPGGKADTAAVKPKGGKENAAVAEYEAFLTWYRAAMREKVIDRLSKTTFRHPWFGKLTAFQWHCLAASHQRVHRKQIEAIIAGLRQEKAI